MNKRLAGKHIVSKYELWCHKGDLRQLIEESVSHEVGYKLMEELLENGDAHISCTSKWEDGVDDQARGIEIYTVAIDIRRDRYY